MFSVVARSICRKKFIPNFIYKTFVSKFFSADVREKKNLILSEDTLVNSDENIKYNDLYFNYFSKINKDEATKFVSDSIQIIVSQKSYSNLKSIKAHLYAFFIDYPFQLVEFYKNAICKENEFVYFGSKSSEEFYILNKIIHFENKEKFFFKKNNFSLFLFHITQKAKKYISDYQLLSFSKIALRFNNLSNLTLPNLFQEKKIILISVVEERRFSRINEIYNKFISEGYDFLIYCNLPKNEINIALKKYPQLEKHIVTDNMFITKSELKSIYKSSIFKINRLNIDLVKSGKLMEPKYKNVSLLNVFWSKLIPIIKYRYVEINIVEKTIDRLLNKYKVNALVTFDNSIASSVLINKAKLFNIPSFFYLYNSHARDLVYYDLQIFSHSPNYWLFSGQRHLEAFQLRKSDFKNFKIVGDPLNDLFFRLDHQKNKKELKKKYKFNDHEKIVVLLSSYISNDFTEDRKILLLESINNSVRNLGLTLIIKAHPNENHLSLIKLVEKIDKNIPIYYYDNIFDIFLISDLVCMFNSEAAQLAMLMKIPVLSLLPNNLVEIYDSHWQYYSTNAVAFLELSKNPTRIIKNLIFDDEIRFSQIKNGSLYLNSYSDVTSGPSNNLFFDIINSKSKLF